MFKQGLAKSLFVESFQHTPWLSGNEEKIHIWPLIDRYLKQKNISYIDYIFVHTLLRSYPQAEEDTALFLCHLVMASKEGHLCVEVRESELIPSVIHLWQSEEGDPLDTQDEQSLYHLILNGSKKIPSELVTNIEENSGFHEVNPETFICKQGQKWYLQKHWNYETIFLRALKKHIECPLLFSLNLAEVNSFLEVLLKKKVLLKEQAQAILMGCSQPISLITGGPGTGKTYTAGILITTFWNQLTVEQRSLCKIVLTAPTGKAAANLQKSLNDATSSLENFPKMEAKTLHALLGIKNHSILEDHGELNADLILVDECSMVDIKMMAWLLKSLKPGSRLILLGDPHQLPSVESGSVFIDLNHAHEHCKLINIPRTMLNVCMRTELKPLVDFACLVKEGQTQEAIGFLNQANSCIQRLVFSQDKREARQHFVHYAARFFPPALSLAPNHNELLQNFQTIRILSPLKNGPFGVETLNQLIWKHHSQNLPHAGWIAIPIMITANDYQQGLFNGETGILMRKLPLKSISKDDYAIFPSRQANEEPRILSALHLQRYEYAYCLSVHKSQGSEFDHVILALPKGSERFGREVLYTAITRAKKQIEIYGTDNVLSQTIQTKGMRLSGILERLNRIV